MTTAELFPLSAEDVVGSKFASLFAIFKGSIAVLSDPNRPPRQPPPPSSQEEAEQQKAQNDANEQRRQLETLVEKLKRDLGMFTLGY
jgi:hypothetical protein